ncbi:MAG TPA: YciI family protein [Longimicrobium sp.]|nr:YciI family protein [Longimicrobium sp.]
MNFFCKLVAPRADFVQTMTPAEGQLMQEHGAYWREWLAKGHVIAFGLVGDPRRAFGIGIVEFDNEEEARAFTDGDPTIESGQGFAFEVLPMPFGVVRG